MPMHTLVAPITVLCLTISQFTVADHVRAKQQIEFWIVDDNSPERQLNGVGPAWSASASSKTTQHAQMTALDQPVSCSISERKDQNRITVRGRVVTPSPEQGTFSLQVKKAGPSGSSVLNQSGTFSTEANRETFLGHAEFNLLSSDKFSARLEIQVRDKAYVCESDGE